MTEAEKERAAIVAWLHGAKPAMEGGLRGRVIVALYMIFKPQRLLEIGYRATADAIERGDHLENVMNDNRAAIELAEQIKRLGGDAEVTGDGKVWLRSKVYVSEPIILAECVTLDGGGK